MTDHGNDGNDGNERERRGNGDPIETLRSELKRVPLSPEFAARLRQRIDEAPATSGAAWLTGWRWLVPVAAAAAVVVLAVSVSQRRPEAPAPVTARASSTAASPPADVQTTVTPVSAAASRQAGADRAAGRSVQSVAAEPALEVITNQPALYRALWARAGKGPALVEVTTTVLPDVAPEIVVPPIEVSPIVVMPLGDPILTPGVPPIVR